MRDALTLFQYLLAAAAAFGAAAIFFAGGPPASGDYLVAAPAGLALLALPLMLRANGKVAWCHDLGYLMTLFALLASWWAAGQLTPVVG
ncbi:hypothetical protein [Bordetella pseudohinzii]|uniref:hypothetical protein n=1 Tax=Bordetella pseudohinzii TaxID=1331258 RepID=UPI001940334C|nr:hypothetical protein [Bordetella pseudohinzii]